MHKLQRVASLFLSIISIGPRNLFLGVEHMASLKVKPRLETHLNNELTLTSIQGDEISEMLKSGKRYESHIYEISKAVLMPTDSVIDIGANIGVHSISFSKLVPNGKVYSFEPSGFIFSLLQKNIKDNVALNCHSFKFAITQSFEVLKISTENFSKKKTNTGNQSLTNHSWGENVLSLGLDQFDFKNIKLIKMDIQGSEVQAVVGMAKLLAESRPLVIFEVEENQLKLHNSTSQDLLQSFLDLDYEIFRINTSYPADHLAVPTQEVFDVLRKLKHLNPDLTLTHIKGRKVRLFFEEGSTLYSRFEVE